jgi:hypothetical protein
LRAKTEQQCSAAQHTAPAIRLLRFPPIPKAKGHNSASTHTKNTSDSTIDSLLHASIYLQQHSNAPYLLSNIGTQIRPFGSQYGGMGTNHVNCDCSETTNDL